MGNATQRELDGGTGRTFRHHHAWCWNVAPVIVPTGEFYDEIQLDGTYLSGGWFLLTAIDGASGDVLGIQWTDTEKYASWKALLDRLPPPRVVVIDGGQGLASALKACWPEARVQRCLVHVLRNIRRETTLRPRTDAGKALLRLGRALVKVETIEQADAWLAALNAWFSHYGHLTELKTYASEKGVVRPNEVRASMDWWWTHLRLRRGYKLLRQLARKGHLFTFLDPEFADLNLNRTTNRIEGGINAPLKDLLRRHRGMTSAHQRRAVEWWCYLRSPYPAEPTSLIRPEHWQPSHKKIIVNNEIPGDWGTEPTAEEGLWLRKGWAGRTTT